MRTLRAIVEDLESLPESDDAYAQWTRALLRLAHARRDHRDASATREARSPSWRGPIRRSSPTPSSTRPATGGASRR